MKTRTAKMINKKIFLIKRFISVILILTTVLVGFSSCNSNKTDYNQKEPDKDTQQIKETPETKYNNALKLIKEGKYEAAAEILESIISYKDSEKLLSHFYYIQTRITINNGTETGGVKKILNSQNNITKVINTNFDGTNEIYDYSYDNYGNVIKQIYTSFDGTITVYDYTYDTTGNKTKEIETDADGYKTTKSYLYDTNGNKIKENWTFYGGEITVDFIYDNNNLIKEVATASRGEKSITDYTYDSDKNLIKRLTTTFSGSTEITLYTYDESGNIIRASHASSDGDYESYDYMYNSDNVLIKTVYTDSDNNREILDYSYDANGCLIKSVITQNNVITLTVDVKNTLVYIPSEITETMKEILEYNPWFIIS